MDRAGLPLDCRLTGRLRGLPPSNCGHTPGSGGRRGCQSQSMRILGPAPPEELPRRPPPASARSRCTPRRTPRTSPPPGGPRRRWPAATRAPPRLRGATRDVASCGCGRVDRRRPCDRRPRRRALPFRRRAPRTVRSRSQERAPASTAAPRRPSPHRTAPRSALGRHPVRQVRSFPAEGLDGAV